MQYLLPTCLLVNLYTISFWNHVNHTKVGMQLISIEIHTAFIAKPCRKGKKWKNLYKRILRTLWGRKKLVKFILIKFQKNSKQFFKYYNTLKTEKEVYRSIN